MRRFEPLKGDHWLVGNPESLCPFCKEQFKEGDVTTLIDIGPGNSAEDWKRKREGRAYNAIALPAHWDCATDPNNEEREVLL